MRLENFALRTWLLAAFAGWGLLACALGLSGLGRRVEPLPEDPQLAQALPPLPAAAQERLQPLAQYGAIAERPAFAQDRRPHPFFLAGGEAGSAPASLRLTGVLLTPQLRMATLTTEQGSSLRLRLEGESVDGWRLLALQPRSATVEGPGGTQTLELQVFAGQDPAPAPAPAAPPQNGLPAVPAPPAGEAAPRPSEEQMKAIRERIEARRRELQRQNDAPPGKNP